MRAIEINWLALGVAVVSTFVIGGLWYSPLLFMKQWLAMSGVDKSVFERDLPKALVVDLLSSIAIAFVLVHAIRFAGAEDLASGLFVTFWIWLAFVATVLATSVTYEHRPFRFFAINAGYRFVAMMAMGAILTLWK